ncbi:tRNA (Guanine-N(7)-)-methyltransferase [Chloropicon primus]|uniref:tRNA (guanine(46)-N(7))-methyltransferase n=1 Tax=Chloropicon primus TaxID=1764295 RepID=A0A5B8MZ18_9CHLO|nr:tRNA (Guanine-N(7)-)-methyltransferase [Chloropicon primus]UPR03862.1 tRNA (Guanine-N(7)-)-methyltransferase [Chloropicon primus]|mmetsp:Transcript_1509/g.3372  ORF Transcript_1509/g.3372 Transcript_1509/m.3372 type:complete len:258 (-) Transcript_1509:62-835(-)|eukprot:QDZ24654.1 tRNA (Guanine-N(7)-)-methyltransferase [Chloropicon primus]
MDGADLWGTSKDLYEKAGGVGGGGRVRQHINPFKKELQVPSEAVDFTKIYEDCSLPLEIDVGCGSGRFLLARAKRSGGRSNFFGVDIRGKLIERSNKWAKLLGVDSNVHYFTTNATVSFESALSKYPGKVTLVSVQYPDPHFKTRHQKRRIVQDDFIAQVGRVLDPAGHVFLQSDVLEVLVDMHNRFESSPRFRVGTEQEIAAFALSNGCLGSSDGEVLDEDGWIKENPTGVPTEREIHASSDGERVYRSIFRRADL